MSTEVFCPICNKDMAHYIGELSGCNHTTTDLVNHINALQAKLDVTLTDLHDSTAQLVMDDAIIVALKAKLDDAVEALKNIRLHYSWDDRENDYAYYQSNEALKRLEE